MGNAENPKHYAGAKKVPFGDTPAIVEAELSVAMHEGAHKYGAFNYRKDKVRASDYFAAARRHLTQWYELGEDVDSESGLSHLVKAMACLAVIRDAEINGMVIDDRPPPVSRTAWEHLENVAADLRARHQTTAQRITSWNDEKSPQLEPGPIRIVEQNWAFGGWAEIEGGVKEPNS